MVDFPIPVRRQLTLAHLGSPWLTLAHLGSPWPAAAASGQQFADFGNASSTPVDQIFTVLPGGRIQEIDWAATAPANARYRVSLTDTSNASILESTDYSALGATQTQTDN